MEIRKGAVLKGRYRLDRLLGRGGMASVWRGHDRVLDRPVAVKILSDAIASDPEFLARFRREATVAAGLSHPNLVRIYDYAEADERPYLVMELVPGEDLGALISRGEPVDRPRLAQQLLAALAHIHRAGIVHRDVKPQNVLLEEDGNAKLIDFGIALAPGATALTSTGLIIATRLYVAPEVMAGRPATERSDLFSCGVVLESCEGPTTPLLDAVVNRLTAEDPAWRPPSAQVAMADLEEDEPPVAIEPTEAFAVEPPGSTVPFEPVREPTQAYLRAGRSRRRWAVASGLVAVAVAAGVVVALALGGGTDGGGGGPKVARGAGAKPDPNGTRQTPPGDESTEATEAEEPTEASTTPSANEPEPPRSGASSASALNEQGYELIRAGRYEEAVPVLEESVSAFPAGTSDVNYAYALFNLGDALLRSGRAEEAIPILEQRLQIPNQTAVVQQELEAARSEAAGGGPGGVAGDEEEAQGEKGGLAAKGGSGD
jgi:serine/threonine protein kinase